MPRRAAHLDPDFTAREKKVSGLGSQRPPVADGVTRTIVRLFREPDAVTPPVRFDKRGCGNEAGCSY